MADATTDPALYLREGILGTRWENGDRIDYVSSKTADMMARHIVEGPRTVLVLTDDEVELLHEGMLRDLTDGMFDDDDVPLIESLMERLAAAVSE